MDPDAALDRIRALVPTVRRLALDPETAELADVVDGLDGWLTQGGHPPTAWREPEPGSPFEAPVPGVHHVEGACWCGETHEPGRIRYRLETEET